MSRKDGRAIVGESGRKYPFATPVEAEVSQVGSGRVRRGSSSNSPHTQPKKKQRGCRKWKGWYFA